MKSDTTRESGATPDSRSSADQATILTHAQFEHPDVTWDGRGATFTTGRFAGGRAR